jgi:pyruvate dehydrogenase (NADP+)
LVVVGGLDHVEAFKSNDVNVLVVDTEMYSNTGGQASKATPIGASAKFAMDGKKQSKKSLGEIFMTYQHVYVASVSLHDQGQTLRAFIEADQYKGPSIIIAYAPCVQQGIRPHGLNDMFEECKFAVDCGYWPLYRYNPGLAVERKNPFILDSMKLRKDLIDFLKRESRFLNLRNQNPVIAEGLWETMNNVLHQRMDHLNELNSAYNHFKRSDGPSVLVLFASETGNAARIARDFAAASPLSSAAVAMDDVDLDDLDGKVTVFFVATCGQGKMPQNGRHFSRSLEQRKAPFKEGTRFMVFGLGDSSYYFFAKAAKDIDSKMEMLGATKLLQFGAGDDSAEGGLEGGLADWLENVWPVLGLQAPAEVPHATPIDVVYSVIALVDEEHDRSLIENWFHSSMNAVSLPIVSNDLMCRPNYNRDFRRITISKGQLEHELGDTLEIFPSNDPVRVSEFLRKYSSDFGEHTVVKIRAFGLDGDISVGALFTYVLDLFGKPSKHLLHELAVFESSEEKKMELLDPAFIGRAAKESGMTVADILLRFSGARPPLPALFSMIPRIKPRSYSIASAPSTSEFVIELLVLIDTWWCDEGMRYGMNCDMLRKLHSGDRLWCRIKAGSMEPPSIHQPVVCVGIGSGLAPHMAFLRDRVRAAEDGQSVAPFSLYFGNRFREEEYLYESELEGWAEKYDWFSLHTAFSRDDRTKKVYVQDLVSATDDARRLLRDTTNGMLYVCGNRGLPRPLQQALVKSFASNSTDSVDLENAGTAVDNLFVHGRAQQEVW